MSYDHQEKYVNIEMWMDFILRDGLVMVAYELPRLDIALGF